MSKQHIASSIDDFLKEEGIFEEAPAEAVEEVVAYRLFSRAVVIHPQSPRSRSYDTGVHRKPVLPPQIVSLI